MKYILILFFLLFNCYDKNRLDSWEIQKRINLMVEAKASECGNRPRDPLLFTQERPPGEVNDCVVAIASIRCPFRNYPWSCVRIF
jgi:hypothetical protein